ncbi:unnamed protein product [Clavelina lepadiformis]|uniref:Uncharacterized protein n=1 Tax=Clavelina lepadiformis TaxID=159417 RepID=A0ABP0FI47_CLALP
MDEEKKAFYVNARTISTRSNLYKLSITFMLCYAAYAGVLSLQSSMNVEEGLGTTSVMVTFITSSISAVFLVPYMVDFMGSKNTIIFGEFAMLVYIAANFYPSWYTLMPAAIFYGLTESAPWAGTSVYVTILGERRWQKKRCRASPTDKSKESYSYGFYTLFNAFVIGGDLIGSGIQAAVLNAFNNVQNPTSTASNSSLYISSSFAYATTPSGDIKQSSLSECGAKDCPSKYAYNGTDEDLDKYNPNPVGVYVLISLFVAMSITSMAVQFFSLPNLPSNYGKQLLHENNEDTIEMKETNLMEPEMKTSKLFKAQKQLKAIFLHIVSPKHLLMMPFLFYYGVYYGFLVADFTRAYISCTAGVEKVGITIAVLAISGAIASALGTKIIPAIGRRGFIILTGSLNLAVYILSLTWQPTPDNIWITYLIASMHGVTDVMFLSLQQGLIALYFEDRLGIAFGVKNGISNLGIALATGWSTALCVYTKIYVQIGLLGISLICLALLDLKFLRSRK